MCQVEMAASVGKKGLAVSSFLPAKFGGGTLQMKGQQLPQESTGYKLAAAMMFEDQPVAPFSLLRNQPGLQPFFVPAGIVEAKPVDF